MTQYMKAIISNKYVEVTQQSSPPFVRRTSSGGRKSFSNQSIENYEANLKVSINRARKRIRRLLECNFTDKYAFVTLTFKPSEEIDVTDIKICHKMFCDFKKRLTYYLQKNQLPEFKYLGVIEFQDENRQGAVHYHLVCNLIEIPLGTLQELWQNGWVYRSIVKSDVLENEKIVHYLNKGITDKRLRGKKKYLHSKGLKQPLALTIEDPEEFYDALDKFESTLIDGGTYHSPFYGETKYENYYVKNVEELINHVQEL
jgi:hypothetical protein